MTQPVTIAVPGKPVPWARARTGKGIHFTPETQRHCANLMLAAPGGSA